MTGGKRIGPSRWALTGLFGLLALSIAFGGYGFYRQETRAIRKEKYGDLKAIAGLKAGQILQWRRERLTDARMNSSGIIRTDVLRWLKAPGAVSRAAVLARLQRFRGYEGYEDMIVAGPDGRILLSLDPRLAGLGADAKRLVAQAVSSRDIAFGDFHRSSASGRVFLDVAAPIFDEGSRPAAVLLLRSDPGESLYPLIQSWPTPSRSAETLLVRRDGDSVLFLNVLRHRPATALTLRIPLSQADVPAVRAALGQTGEFEGRDYRGVKVLADVRSIPGSPWFLVAKVDSGEILAEARYHGQIIGLFTLALVLLAGAATSLFYKHSGKRAYQALFRAEWERREALEEFRATLRGIGDGVISTDGGGCVRQMNPMAESLTGWRESEAVGKPLADVFRIVNEHTRDGVESPVGRVLREGRVVGMANHTVLIARDGAERPIADSGAPVRDEEGVIIGVVLVFRDQTEERAAQRALEESERMLKESQRVAAVGHYVLDVASGRWSSSEMLDEIFGIGRSHVRDVEGWLGIVHPEQREEMSAYFGNHVLGGRNPFDKEYRILRVSDHAERWLHGRGNLEIDSEGRPVKMFGTIQDITERKRAEEEREKLEEQLRQAQKMESVGRLAGGVAHDFNNMLQAILGHSDLALGRLAKDHPLSEDLREIRKAARRSADLTRQLLGFARKQTVSPRVLDLNETVEGMLKMLHRLIGEDIRLGWKPGPDLWPVKVDPVQVDQVLVNLSANARDAIAGVGSVTIETGNVVFDEDYCRLHAGFVPGEFVLLAVSDTGKGMDKQTLGHIFEPFFTTKEPGKGTGLGLASVYGVVKQNDGFVNVYSEPGMGTAIKIYLPRARARSAEEPAPAEKKPAKGTEAVLLVEDEEAILKLSRRILEGCGYNVLAARTPGDALSLAEGHEGPIHLLVTDVVMPEMNGRDLKERISALRPGLKALYMSGYTANVIAHHGVLGEGVQFLQKPFSVRALAEKVREVLDI